MWLRTRDREKEGQVRDSAPLPSSSHLFAWPLIWKPRRDAATTQQTFYFLSLSPPPSFLLSLLAPPCSSLHRCRGRSSSRKRNISHVNCWCLEGDLVPLLLRAESKKGPDESREIDMKLKAFEMFHCNSEEWTCAADQLSDQLITQVNLWKCGMAAIYRL